MNKDVYSQPFTSNKRVQRISAKIENLWQQITNLQRKELRNKLLHSAKYDKQRAEQNRLRSKISRLKIERAKLSASQIIHIAEKTQSSIALEQLSWAPHSHWEYSLMQRSIQSRADRVGIKVRKVSPKDTSQICPKCAKRIKHSKRDIICQSCDGRLDRDVLASRNIALRALHLKTLPKNYQRIALICSDERAQRIQETSPCTSLLICPESCT